MKLYLAGPDVFRPDAMAWAAEGRQLCAALGYTALIPLDGVETTALGIGYLACNETTTQRVARVLGVPLEIRDGRPVDRDGLLVEDFGLPLNLMLGVPLQMVIGGLPEALSALASKSRR